MASLEEIALLLGKLNDKLESIDTRLVVLEQKSRPPSRSTSPPTKQIEEKRAAFEDAPSPGSKDSSGPLLRELGDDNFFGATGLPYTPAPAKTKPKSSDRAPPPRRDTIHLRSVRKAEEDSQRPVVHASVASYEHISIKKLNLPNFFKFFEAALLYQQREHITLPLPTLVDELVRNQLISKNRGILDEPSFFMLTQEDLYDVMQKVFAPVDRIDFIDKLTKNVEFVFSAHFRPSPEYFQPFYDALILYATRFLKIYEVLAHKRLNDAVIPRCDNKENGLVKIYNSKIPYEFGARLLVLMDKTKWDDIYMFIKDFTAVVDKMRDISEQTKILRRLFGGTQYEAKKFDQKLQQLQQLQSMPVESGDHDDAWHDARAALAEEVDDELTGMLAALQQPHGREPFKKEPYDKGALPKDPLVCITKLLYGTCSKATCSYSHKEDLIAKKRVQFMDLIQKQLAAAKPSAAQRQPQRVSVMDDIYDDDEDGHF